MIGASIILRSFQLLMAYLFNFVLLAFLWSEMQAVSLEARTHVRSSASVHHNASVFHDINVTGASDWNLSMNTNHEADKVGFYIAESVYIVSILLLIMSIVGLCLTRRNTDASGSGFRAKQKTACKMLTQHSHKIIHGLSQDPKAIATTLHSEGFITEELFSEVCELQETKKEKGRKLYCAVLEVLIVYPDRYNKFVAVFETESPHLYKNLLKHLKNVDLREDDPPIFEGQDSKENGIRDFDDSEIDSLNIECKCPCSDRNFRHIVKPPPECLKLRDDKAFPELNLTTGADKRQTQIAQELTEYYLKQGTENIKQLYLKFTVYLRKHLRNKPSIEFYLGDVIQTYSEQRSKSTSFGDLFTEVLELADFINYKPLEMVVECCAEDDRQLELALKSYENDFAKYVQQRVYTLEVPLQSQGEKKLKVKVEKAFKKCTFHHILRLKDIIKKVLNMDDHTQLKVQRVEEGCVEITYHIHRKHADQAFSNGLTHEQKRELASHKISMLQCDGVVHYCCCSLRDELIKDIYEEVTSQQFGEDELREEHVPDCDFLKESKVNACPLEYCTFCGKSFQSCCMEYHSLQCDEETPLLPDVISKTSEETSELVNVNEHEGLELQDVSPVDCLTPTEDGLETQEVESQKKHNMLCVPTPSESACQTLDEKSSTGLEYNKRNLQRRGSDSNNSVDSGFYDDSDIDSLVIEKCKCICGSHNFRHCVEPPPECLKQRGNNFFPELDLTTGADKRQTKIAQHYLNKSVAKQEKTIEKMFSDLVVKLRRTLRDVPHIEENLENLLMLQSGRVVGLSDFDELFSQVTECSDFINYQPLEAIVKYCGPSLKAADALRDYEEAFREFCQRSVFSLPEGTLEGDCQVQDGNALLIVKISTDFHDFRIQDIERLRSNLRSALALDDFTQLRVLRVQEGCVEVTFSIPQHIADQIVGGYRVSSGNDRNDGSGGNGENEGGDGDGDGGAGGLTYRQKRELASHKISLLQCNGVVYYCWCSLLDDEESQDLVKGIVEGHAVHKEDKTNSEMLLAACKARESNLIAVQYYLSKEDTDVNIRENDKFQWTPLMWACHRGHTEIGKLLLKHNPIVNVQDSKMWSALTLASRKGDLEMVQELLDHGAKIDMQTNKKWTPLMWAAQEGKTEVAKLLLKRKHYIIVPLLVLSFACTWQS